MPALTPPSGRFRRIHLNRRRLWPLASRRRNLGAPDDRGAVAAVFVILLSGGVLLGMMAMVIDLGQIYLEREELQSGADAAAVAIAKACANDSTECASHAALVDVAQSYGDLNARDGTSSVEEVCGYLPGRLSECPPAAENLTKCLGSPPPVPAFWVEVRLGTRMPDGQFVLPPSFAQALPGNAGFDGVGVRACARATWEPTAGVLAMTISTCEFDDSTAGGTDFALAPPYPPYPDPLDEHTINFLDPTGCDPDPSSPGWQRPGPAGFLNGDSSCEFDVPLDGIVSGDDVTPPTFAAPPACVARLITAVTSREVVLVPVHDGIHDDPGTTEYHAVFVAPFVVTGFSFDTILPVPSWLINVPPACSGPDACVSGVFVGPAVSLNSLAGDAIVTLIG